MKRRQERRLQQRERNEDGEERRLATRLLGRDQYSGASKQRHPQCVPGNVAGSFRVCAAGERSEEPSRANREQRQPAEPSQSNQTKGSADEGKSAPALRLPKYDLGEKHSGDSGRSPKDRATKGRHGRILASLTARKVVFHHQHVSAQEHG